MSRSLKAMIGLILISLVIFPVATQAARKELRSTKAGATETAVATTPACNQSQPCRTHLPLIQQAAKATQSTTPISPATPTIAPTATAIPDSCAAISAGAITLVTLGDSLTAGDGDDTGNSGFAGRLLQQLQADRPGSTLSNLGRSGWSSNDLINGVNGEPGQLDQAVTLLNQAKNSGNPTIATVWIGSNDLWYLYEFENPTIERELEDAQNYSNNLDTILTQLRATGATVRIALLDDQSKRPVAIAGEAFPSISSAELTKMSQQVIHYNDAMRARAAQQGAKTVDFFNSTIFTDSNTLADDGNHPNAAGYELITDRWFASLESELTGCDNS